MDNNEKCLKCYDSLNALGSDVGHTDSHLFHISVFYSLILSGYIFLIFKIFQFCERSSGSGALSVDYLMSTWIFFHEDKVDGT